MAEIHVQVKRRGLPVWLWILIVLLIIGAAVAIIMYRNKNKTASEQTKPATFVQPVKRTTYYLM